MPPATSPQGTRSRAPRRKRRPPPPSPASVQRATRGALPLSNKPVRPKRVERATRAQRQTTHAQPLSPTPVKPTPVRAPRPTQAKPLSQRPMRNTRAGKPVTNARQERSLAIAAYDQLSHQGKKAQVRESRRNVQKGKASTADIAILHAHDTRVAGKQRVAAAGRAFELLAGEQIGGVGKGLSYPAGTVRYKGRTYLPGGKDVGRAVTTADVKRASAGGRGVATLPSVRTATITAAKYAQKGYSKAGIKVGANAAADIGELATTSPSSVAKFASDAAQHPGKAVKQLAQPYKDFVKDPVKFAKERPVSTALMLAPAARVPGRALGKVARAAGKQTLERPAATLPNTALRQERAGSRDVVRRAVQARRDRRNPQPTVTLEDLHKRVDVAQGRAQVHGERVAASIGGKDAQKAIRKLPRSQRKAATEALDEQIGKAVSANRKRLLANEFGATGKIDEHGRLVDQPHSRTATLHDSQESARRHAEALNAKGQTIPKGRSGSVGPLYAKERKPVQYVVRDAGMGKHAVMPEPIAKRLDVHNKVGTSKAVPAVLLRHSRKAFSKAVLPFHPTWLTGQATEGALRTAVAGAGPTSWMRAHRLESRHPDLYKALAEEAIPGGFYGRTVAHEMTQRTLKAEIPESDVARAFTEFGQKPGLKQVRKLNDAVTGFIFNRLNGQLLEGVPQKVLLGRALKRHPLMDRKIVGLSNKAIDEFAKGGVNRETAVSLGNELRRTYGRYGSFSPRMRSLIMHWTPFVPWYLNMARFLARNLPAEHPVAGALVADIGAIEEQWRKENGLSLRYKNENSLPPWMLGGYPTKGASGLEGLLLGPPGENIVRVGQYAPTASATPTQQAGGLVLPQLVGIYKAIAEGRDWKDQELKHANGKKYNEGEKLLYGTAQLLEALTPGLSQVTYATGAPEILGGPAESDTSTVSDRVKKLVRPVSAVKRRGPQAEAQPFKLPGSGGLPGLNLTEEQQRLLNGG